MMLKIPAAETVLISNTNAKQAIQNAAFLVITALPVQEKMTLSPLLKNQDSKGRGRSAK
jgi:hypothetical protein